MPGFNLLYLSSLVRLVPGFNHPFFVSFFFGLPFFWFLSLIFFFLFSVHLVIPVFILFFLSSFFRLLPVFNHPFFFFFSLVRLVPGFNHPFFVSFFLGSSCDAGI